MLSPAQSPVTRHIVGMNSINFSLIGGHAYNSEWDGIKISTINNAKPRFNDVVMACKIAG